MLEPGIDILPLIEELKGYARASDSGQIRVERNGSTEGGCFSFALIGDTATPTLDFRPAMHESGITTLPACIEIIRDFFAEGESVLSNVPYMLVDSLELLVWHREINFEHWAIKLPGNEDYYLESFTGRDIFITAPGSHLERGIRPSESVPINGLTESHVNSLMRLQAAYVPEESSDEENEPRSSGGCTIM